MFAIYQRDWAISKYVWYNAKGHGRNSRLFGGHSYLLWLCLSSLHSISRDDSSILDLKPARWIGKSWCTCRPRGPTANLTADQQSPNKVNSYSAYSGSRFTSPLWELVCHMGSHSLPANRQRRQQHHNPSRSRYSICRPTEGSRLSQPCAPRGRANGHG